MKKFVLSFCVCVLACVGVQSQPPPLPSLLQPSNLLYQGSFKVPLASIPGVPNSGYEYGGPGLTYNPANNSLFMVGHDYKQWTGEFTIPAYGQRATVITPLTDLLEGHRCDIAYAGGCGAKIGAHLIWGPKLIISDYIYYDAPGQATLSHFDRSLDFATIGQVNGPFNLGQIPLGGTYYARAGFWAGYMSTVPVAWQGALGTTALSGLFGVPIVSRTSWGPAAFGFDPDSMTNSVSPLVFYTDAHSTLGNWNDRGPNPVYNASSHGRGLIFPEGTNTLLFVGRNGLGVFCYGAGGNQPEDLTVIPHQCYDPVDTSKGSHNYPYVLYVWAYDAADLAQVKSGVKQPWEVVPYAHWALKDGAGIDLQGNSDLGGAATYDPIGRRLFVAQGGAEGSPASGTRPLIHVWSLQ